MRTHLEFRSNAFPSNNRKDGEVNPGLFGKRLADFLAGTLPAHGFAVSSVDAEDWGWTITLVNEAFPLWIGCSNYDEYDDGFLCVITPSKPYVRKWFRKISTTDTVENLASALEASLLATGKVSALRWWSGADDGRHA